MATRKQLAALRKARAALKRKAAKRRTKRRAGKRRSKKTRTFKGAKKITIHL